MTIRNKAIVVLVFLFLVQIAAAIPDSINLQGKLTDSSGTLQTGTFNFSIRIYDNFTAGNQLYETNITSATDSRGVFDLVLQNVNISFADQRYVGIQVNDDAEMTPRVNLTSVPYSFRANTTDLLDENLSYTAANLNATGNITLGTRLTFGLGEFIDNLVEGVLKITGGLNIDDQINLSSTGNIDASGTITGNILVANTQLGLLVLAQWTTPSLSET